MGRELMFCNDCGSQVPDGSKFCHQCGKPTTTSTATLEAASGVAQAVRMSPEPAETKRGALNTASHKRSNPTISVLLIALLAVGGWFVYSALSAPRPRAQLAPFVATAPTPVIQPVTIPLAQKAFTIGARQYVYFKFTIPPRSSEVQMRGRFEASGGSGNDIEVVVLNEDAFTNWQNHHSVPTYYNSGRVTVSTLSARLPSTDNLQESPIYYLIFSNIFSVFSNKAVSADITLHYNRVLQP